MAVLWFEYENTERFLNLDKIESAINSADFIEVTMVSGKVFSFGGEIQAVLVNRLKNKQG